MIGMVLLILAEIVLRGLFNSTTEHSDELVGYMLVGLTFLSLALCQSGGAFHRVELVQMRLRATWQRGLGAGLRPAVVRLRRADRLVFHSVVMSSYRREAMASSLLSTPLWIPETAMVVGAALLLIALGKTIVDDVPEAPLMTPTLEILLVMAIFLALLAAGMAIPFAIGVAGNRLPAGPWRRAGAQGHRLMSWGSMNQLFADGDPLFILMAEIMQHSGLSFRIYRGLSKLVCVIPGGLLQTNIAGCALFAAISGSSVATAAAIARLPCATPPAWLRSPAVGGFAGGRRHAPAS